MKAFIFSGALQSTFEESEVIFESIMPSVDHLLLAETIFIFLDLFSSNHIQITIRLQNSADLILFV